MEELRSYRVCHLSYGLASDELIKTSLESLGYKVTQPRKLYIHEDLEMFENLSDDELPDCLIIHINMKMDTPNPTSGGRLCYQKIRKVKRLKAIPILMITHADDPLLIDFIDSSEKIKILAIGVEGVISFPFSPIFFQQKIKILAELGSLRKENCQLSAKLKEIKTTFIDGESKNTSYNGGISDVDDDEDGDVDNFATTKF